MIDRRQRLFDRLDRFHGGRWRATDHQHFDAKPAGRRDLGVGRRSTAVLGDDGIDAMRLQQGDFAFYAEGAAIENVLHVGDGKTRLDGIDAADEIEMLWRCLGAMGFLSADGKKHATRFAAECRDCLRDRADVQPVVTGLRHPCGTSEAEGQKAETGHGFAGVLGDPRCERMGGIDQQIEFAIVQKFGEAIRTAETADPRGQGLKRRLFGSAGKRQQRVVSRVTGQSLRERACLARSAKQQNADLAHA